MKTTEGATQCPFSIEINLRKFSNWTDDAVNLATKRSEFGEQADGKIPGGCLVRAELLDQHLGFVAQCSVLGDLGNSHQRWLRHSPKVLDRRWN